MINPYYVIALCLATIVLPFLVGRKCDLRVLEWSSRIKPPDWVFSAVWTVLYACMAVSLYRLLTCKQATYKNPFFVATLLLTIASYSLNYSYIYMSGCHQNWGKALHILMAYLVVLFPQLLMTYTIDPIAGILLSPLVGWGVIATIMNCFYVS